MARNRKRAKDRRARRPAADPGSGRGVATARGRGPAGEHGQSPDAGRGAPGDGLDPAASALDPEAAGLDPAAADGELGSEASGEGLEPPTPSAIEHGTPDVDLVEAQLALGRAEAAGEVAGYPGPDEADDDFGEADSAQGAELARSGAGAPAARSLPGGRLVNFLQGSWRELQRVQWPDRRQVMQATGVVIGFVIVAGLFLGLADLVATNVVNFILK